MIDLPSGRYWHGSVTISRNAFIVGGLNNKTIDRYDKLTNTFLTVNTMTNVRSGFGICTTKGKIIISGGYDGSKRMKSCFLYKPSSNWFKQIASMNVERRGHALVNMNDKFFFSIGGWNSQNDYLNIIEQYEPETDVWTIFNQKLNIARGYHQTVAYKQWIYVIGGITRNNNLLDSIEKINIITGTTSLLKTKLKVARTNFALAKINDNVYIIGGNTSLLITDPTDTVEIFNMEDETLTDGINIPIKDYGFTACVL